MANYETVIYEKAEDKIYRLTLNRPEKLNALSQKLLKELDSVMDEYESNPDASVLIIRGAGRAFSAGYDLQGTQHPGSTFTVTNDRASARLLSGGRHRIRRPLRYRVRQRGCAVRSSRGPLTRYPADHVDVAGADGSAQNQRILFHRRLHVGEGSARVAPDQSRLPKGQARGRNDELRATGRDGSGRAADVAQGRHESLPRYHRDSRGRAVSRRH